LVEFGDEPRSVRVEGGKQQGERILLGMGGQLVQNPLEVGLRIGVALAEGV
jgi:hypothetical protein